MACRSSQQVETAFHYSRDRPPHPRAIPDCTVTQSLQYSCEKFQNADLYRQIFYFHTLQASNANPRRSSRTLKTSIDKLMNYAKKDQYKTKLSESLETLHAAGGRCCQKYICVAKNDGCMISTEGCCLRPGRAATPAIQIQFPSARVPPPPRPPSGHRHNLLLLI